MTPSTEKTKLQTLHAQHAPIMSACTPRRKRSKSSQCRWETVTAVAPSAEKNAKPTHALCPDDVGVQFWYKQSKSSRHRLRKPSTPQLQRLRTVLNQHAHHAHTTSACNPVQAFQIFAAPSFEAATTVAPSAANTAASTHAPCPKLRSAALEAVTTVAPSH